MTTYDVTLKELDGTVHTKTVDADSPDEATSLAYTAVWLEYPNGEAPLLINISVLESSAPTTAAEAPITLLGGLATGGDVAAPAAGIPLVDPSPETNTTFASPAPVSTNGVSGAPLGD